MADMETDLPATPRLRLALAEADFVRLEGEKAEAEVALAKIKAELAIYNRQSILGALCCIMFVVIPVVLPILVFLYYFKGKPLARRQKEAEETIARTVAAMNAKRLEIAGYRVEQAALG